jgi:hypothetical protein
MNDTIRPPAASDQRASLVLWLPAGRIVCEVAGRARCSDPGGKDVCVKESAPVSPTIAVADCVKASSANESRLLGAILKWVRHEPRRYVPLLSRGGPPPHDAVVRYQSSGVDIAPIIKSFAAGKYEICARPFGSASTDDWTVQGEIAWKGKGPAVFRPKLAPGLYEMWVEGPVGGSIAWVLVAEGAAFERAKSEFDMATTVVSTWRGDNGTEARLALRALLRSLAGY